MLLLQTTAGRVRAEMQAEIPVGVWCRTPVAFRPASRRWQTMPTKMACCLVSVSHSCACAASQHATCPQDSGSLVPPADTAMGSGTCAGFPALNCTGRPGDDCAQAQQDVAQYVSYGIDSLKIGGLLCFCARLFSDYPVLLPTKLVGSRNTATVFLCAWRVVLYAPIIRRLSFWVYAGLFAQMAAKAWFRSFSTFRTRKWDR